MAEPTSIRNAAEELGGTQARQGFSYQDQVAVAFLVEMLSDSTLEQVWCEVVDDITLLWKRGDQEVVEFVQVKTDDPGQLWTVALLCQRESKKKGTSILERSLSRATCEETCRFRLVTVVEFAPELHPLRHQLGHPIRKPGSLSLESIVAKVEAKLTDWPRGRRDPRFWVENATLESRGVEEAVMNATHVRIGDLLSEAFGIGFPDQVRDVYGSLLATAFKAALGSGEDKKLTRAQVQAAFKRRVHELKQIPTRGRLRSELQAIGIPPEMIDEIVWCRLEYGRARRSSPYSTRYDALDVTELVQNAVHSLRLRYEAGMLPDDPAQFHVRCLEVVQKLRETTPELADVPPKQLEGALYDLVERGLHGFRRSSP